eukprot:s1005_g24.t1
MVGGSKAPLLISSSSWPSQRKTAESPSDVAVALRARQRTLSQKTFSSFAEAEEDLEFIHRWVKPWRCSLLVLALEVSTFCSASSSCLAIRAACLSASGFRPYLGRDVELPVDQSHDRSGAFDLRFGDGCQQH